MSDRVRRRRRLVLAPCVFTLLAAAAAYGQTQRVFFTDFDAPGGAPAEFSGVTTLAPVQGFSSITGPVAGKFGGNLLHNTTGGLEDPLGRPGRPTRLTLTGLPQHNAVDLNFLLGIMNTWDGPADYLDVTVDGRRVFHESFDFMSTMFQTYVPPAGGLLTPRQDGRFSYPDHGFDNPYGDAAYDMGLERRFHNIPHSGSTLTVEIAAGLQGPWEGGTNESWGIDNFEVVLRGVPEPSGLGSAGVAGALLLRRRRALPAD